MKILLSPAKKQNMVKKPIKLTSPYYLDEAEELISLLKELKREEFQKLLGISDKLTDENIDRLYEWDRESSKGSPAMFTYSGEVFSNLKPFEFNDDELDFAEDSLRLFSGLYGILKPSDSISPYRLDVADRLKLEGFKNLYEYWIPKVTEYLKKDLAEDKDNFIVDLSSKEYSKTVDFKQIDAKIITPDFRVWTGSGLKVQAIWSKKMRGTMAREIIKNRVVDEVGLQKIELPDYKLEGIDNGNYLYVKSK